MNSASEIERGTEEELARLRKCWQGVNDCLSEY